jgi:hypothetical protein
MGRDGYKVVVHAGCKEAFRSPEDTASAGGNGHAEDEDDLAIPQFLRRSA